MLTIRIAIFVGVLAFQPVAAQDERTFTSRANLVPVPTLVRGADGHTIEGLRVDDFIVEDDGVRQKVRSDEDHAPGPISLMIAVQCGRRAKREYDRTSTLESMLDPILSNPNNESAVLFFDSKLNLARDFTNNADSIEEDLKNLPLGDSGAVILDAAAYSARLLARQPEGRQRVLLLISESRDHGSHFAELDDMVRLIGENSISVYALSFSPYISQQLDTVRGRNKDEWSPNVDILEKLEDIHQAMRKNSPKALASLTGGEYESFSTRHAFESDMLNFTNHLYSRYVLSFEPKSPHVGLHQIRVRLREHEGGQSVLFRSSYWVGDSPEASAR